MSHFKKKGESIRTGFSFSYCLIHDLLGISYRLFIRFASARSAFMSAMTMSTMTNEKGSAAIIIVFCKAVRPFTDSKMSAIVDWINPQMSFTVFGGVNEPFVDCIPSTKVAESADVTKNEAINKTAATDRNNEKGIVSNISKIVSSVLNCVKSAMPFL